VLAALFSALCSAAFLIPWKLATRHGDPDLLVLCLLTFAAIFSTVTALFDRSNLQLLRGHLGPTLKLALLMSTFTLAGNWASAESVHRVSGALLAVLQRCELIAVALLGAVLLGERVHPSFWVGAIVAVSGLVLLQDHDANAHANFDPAGVLYGLASATFFGTMIVLQRRYLHGVHLVPVNALRLWFGVALWFVIYRRIPDSSELTAPLLTYTAAAALFGPFLSRLGTLVSARHVPASVTVFVGLWTPIFTLVLAWLWLGDFPAQHELIGGAVMLTGIAIPAVAMLRR
jgi:drug/metabolite transporter (DMT)-like permease